MKVVLINGSPHREGCTYTALHEVENMLHENGIETHWHWIGVKPLAGCIACHKCKDGSPCVFDDTVNELNAIAGEMDGMIVGSPVYYAGPSGQVCAFLDRLFYSSHGMWIGKPGAAVVSCRRGGASAAFDRLNKYFQISCMPVVSSQYWNQVHGNTPDEVRQDLEGLQTMRQLGRNFAYQLKAMEAAAKEGIQFPEREPFIRTNFIR